MTTQEIKNWLGKYFLLMTAGIGGYILLANETKLLPIEDRDVTPTLQIIIPVLVGQLALIAKAITIPSPEEVHINVPKWLVTWPAFIVLLLFVFGVIRVIYLNRSPVHTVSGAANLRAILTFCSIFAGCFSPRGSPALGWG